MSAVAEFVRVGAVSDFPLGRGKMVRVDGRRIAVFRVEPEWYGLQDDCPHMGASLADGRIVDGRVTCHMHDWIFDLATGKGCPPSKSWACARVYEVRIDGNDVLVRRPEPDTTQADEEWPVWNDDMLRE